MGRGAGRRGGRIDGAPPSGRERGALGFVLPEAWRTEILAEYGGQLSRVWKVAPQRWVPQKVAVRRALAEARPHMVVTGARGTAEPAFDVSGALERAAEALRVGCGKAEGGITPLLEILVADEARLHA
jgi:hypothetical protein